MTSSVRLWRIAAERQWHQGRLPWVLWWLAVGAALLVLASATLKAMKLEKDNEQLRADIAAAEQNPTPAVIRPAQVAAADFVHRLPPPLGHAQLLNELNRLQQELGVRVEMLSLRERAPSTDQLGRSDVSLSTLGGYRATTQLLKALIERHPGATLHSLQMRRLQGSVDIEGQFVVAFWTAPAGMVRFVREP
jgi:hypothetical protein